MADLKLEFRNDFRKDQDQFKVNSNITILTTPALDEDYWLFRVKLHEDQSIIAFPKFGTIGIGFAQEEDWNTNLPYRCDAEKIYDHISHNKKYDEISKEDCIKAIRILQKASAYFKEHEELNEPEAGDLEDFQNHMDKLIKIIQE